MSHLSAPPVLTSIMVIPFLYNADLLAYTNEWEHEVFVFMFYSSFISFVNSNEMFRLAYEIMRFIMAFSHKIWCLQILIILIHLLPSTPFPLWPLPYCDRFPSLSQIFPFSFLCHIYSAASFPTSPKIFLLHSHDTSCLSSLKKMAYVPSMLLWMAGFLSFYKVEKYLVYMTLFL